MYVIMLVLLAAGVLTVCSLAACAYTCTPRIGRYTLLTAEGLHFSAFH